MDDSRPIEKRRGANLPHWIQDRATYFVTFRTADSLPPSAVEKLKAETRLLERQAQWQELEPEELARLSKLRSEGYLGVLDKCYGECVLRRHDCAETVANALTHFAEVEYRLWAWCVMPNHIHAVVQPFDGIELSRVLQGWKSVSSKRINKLLGRIGVFWQSESFDRIVRDEAEFKHYVNYTLNNPSVAGLHNWKWTGRHTD